VDNRCANLCGGSARDSGELSENSHFDSRPRARNALAAREEHHVMAVFAITHTIESDVGPDLGRSLKSNCELAGDQLSA
jgi:hypothetical protein